jgi:hypothetical protein
VNWLRASARFQRWDEEVLLLKHEMRWTVEFFKFKKEAWSRLAVEAKTPTGGLACYAKKQADAWARFQSNVEQIFSNALIYHPFTIL